MRSRRYVFLLVFGLVGCGGDWGGAQGTVTLDDKPLEDGLITFHPLDEGPTAYGQVKSGSFTINTGQKAGLRTGMYKVTVSATTIPEPGSATPSRLLTPKKYSRKETTDLEAKVEASSNRFTFALRSSP